LHYIDGELAEVVSSRPASRAYRVSPMDGQVQEKLMTIRFLG
jgi:hypothetical protein